MLLKLEQREGEGWAGPAPGGGAESPLPLQEGRGAWSAQASPEVGTFAPECITAAGQVCPLLLTFGKVIEIDTYVLKNLYIFAI